MNLKKNDVILILSVLIVAIVLMLGINIWIKKDGSIVAVTVDGTEYTTASLNEDKEISIVGIDGGKNTLVIKAGRAYMSKADCPDKICINQGKISKTGETIVCLPHKIVVEIKGDTNDNNIDSVVQ